VASQMVKTMIKKDIKVNGAKILNLGITFKENCPDVRNTKAVDVIKALADYAIEVTTYDPWANPEEVMHEYGLVSSTTLPNDTYDALILTVSHREFLELNLAPYLKNNSVIYDVKGVLKVSDNKL
jgi:UDP-N-acetyl-D-galactosamine dehydrogenase